MSRARWALLLFILCLLAAWLVLPGPAPTISGRVRNDQGPVAGAHVRVQGDDTVVLSDAHGRFHLPRPAAGTPTITAWKAGYRIAAADSGSHFDLLLSPLPEKDNDDYRWIDPVPRRDEPFNCGNCHEAIYREWQASSHAHSARNPRFLSLYNGRKAQGPPASFWNLRREHPLGSGVCASCHAPTFSDSTLDYDLAKIEGVARRGVHCDYCHKVVDAPATPVGTRFGRDALTLLRPANGDQLFFGSLEDAVRAGESFGYAPLYKESRYCASCHEGVIFGVHVYGTYSEWLESPARARGQQCQSCHMAPDGHLSNIAPGKGGVARDPSSLASHALPGATVEMLRRCLELSVTVAPADGQVEAGITVRADHVGHRVPTGFIDRNLVLVVDALGAKGESVPQLAGPRLHAAAGSKLEGRAGRLYAKQLHGADGRMPVPFWLPAGEMADTRLRPGSPDRSVYRFAAQARTLRVQLLYRRFWPVVAEERGWTDNEMVVLERTVGVH